MKKILCLLVASLCAILVTAQNKDVLNFRATSYGEILWNSNSQNWKYQAPKNIYIKATMDHALFTIYDPKGTIKYTLLENTYLKEKTDTLVYIWKAIDKDYVSCSVKITVLKSQTILSSFYNDDNWGCYFIMKTE